MAHDLRVSPETATPSFEKGNMCLMTHESVLSEPPFNLEKGAFFVIQQLQ